MRSLTCRIADLILSDNADEAVFFVGILAVKKMPSRRVINHSHVHFAPYAGWWNCDRVKEPLRRSEAPCNTWKDISMLSYLHDGVLYLSPLAERQPAGGALLAIDRCRCPGGNSAQ